MTRCVWYEYCRARRTFTTLALQYCILVVSPHSSLGRLRPKSVSFFATPLFVGRDEEPLPAAFRAYLGLQTLNRINSSQYERRTHWYLLKGEFCTRAKATNCIARTRMRIWVPPLPDTTVQYSAVQHTTVQWIVALHAQPVGTCGNSNESSSVHAECEAPTVKENDKKDIGE